MTASVPPLDALTAARDELANALAALPDAALGRGGLEGALLTAAADELRALIGIEVALETGGWRPTAAIRHARTAIAARRRVEARLVGVPTALLDREPAAGEWSARRVIEHLIANDRRYAIQTLHAATRSDADPLRPADSALPDRTPDAVMGEPMHGLIGRLRATQRASLTPLLALTDDQLRRPTDWAGSRQAVAFRLDRFGQHVDEHAVDLEGTLAAVRFVPTRATRIAAARVSQLGALEAALLAVPAERLDTPMADRAPTIGDRLERLTDTDRRLLADVREAVV